MAHLNTMAERAWYAYHCLLREDGKPPKIRPFEEAHGIHNGTLKRVFLGRKPRADMLGKVAIALGVTMDYLVYGIGDPPKLTGPLPSIATLQKGQETPPDTLEMLVERAKVSRYPALGQALEERLRAGTLNDSAARSVWEWAQHSPIDFDKTTWHFVLRDFERV